MNHGITMKLEIASRRAFLLLTLSLTACDTTEPQEEATLDYVPTRWIITGAIEADALAEGATLSLVLEQGGRVNGSLFMPPSIVGPEDLTADLAGTWVKRGDTIQFNQITRTFVSEIPWILSPETLTAADSFEGSFYDVELKRVFR